MKREKFVKATSIFSFSKFIPYRLKKSFFFSQKWEGGRGLGEKKRKKVFRKQLNTLFHKKGKIKKL